MGTTNRFRVSGSSFHAANLYQDTRGDDIQSTQSSVIMRDSLDVVDGTKSALGPKRSLAEDLRIRREMKERLSIDKMNRQITNALNERSEPMTPMDIRRAAKKVPT
jgi:hypothetical protein